MKNIKLATFYQLGVRSTPSPTIFANKIFRLSRLSLTRWTANGTTKRRWRRRPAASMASKARRRTKAASARQRREARRLEVQVKAVLIFFDNVWSAALWMNVVVNNTHTKLCSTCISTLHTCCWAIGPIEWLISFYYLKSSIVCCTQKVWQLKNIEFWNSMFLNFEHSGDDHQNLIKPLRS